MSAKDFFGNEINVGDTVAFMEKGYRNFLTGTINKLTEKMLVVSHGSYETKQFHDQVIKKIK